MIDLPDTQLRVQHTYKHLTWHPAQGTGEESLEGDAGGDGMGGVFLLCI